MNLIYPYIYFMALIYILYGENDCSKFYEAWITLVYIVAISGSSFNWGAIISKKLSTYLVQAQMMKEGEAPAFHMDLYLLDVIYARNVFADMNLIWEVVEFLFMFTSTYYGRTCTKNPMPLFVMNSSPSLFYFI
jgi:hypothetical protein